MQRHVFLGIFQFDPHKQPSLGVSISGYVNFCKTMILRIFTKIIRGPQIAKYPVYKYDLINRWSVLLEAHQLSRFFAFLVKIKKAHSSTFFIPLCQMLVFVREIIWTPKLWIVNFQNPRLTSFQG